MFVGSVGTHVASWSVQSEISSPGGLFFYNKLSESVSQLWTRSDVALTSVRTSGLSPSDCGFGSCRRKFCQPDFCNVRRHFDSSLVDVWPPNLGGLGQVRCGLEHMVRLCVFASSLCALSGWLWSMGVAVPSSRGLNS